jgi:hypothetical protein
MMKNWRPARGLNGQEWGAIAKVRAGDNGDINADYKALD